MDPKSLELATPLQILPPVEFCCAYGSSLLSNNNDKTSMVDYILGVLDPIEWHSKNLERNRHHYSKFMAGLGPKALAWVANRIGAGVHFNPFVEWKNKEIKYGVVGVQDLAREVLTWDKFFLCGRLQKPVHVLVDNWDIRKANLVNLKSATSAALLLLPPEFSEEDLYAKICSLSYTGDLRMLFAEDKNKVNKIVRGSFESFRSMYSPMLQEYAVEGLLRSHALSANQKSFKQDYSLSATSSLFSTVICTTQNQMAPKLQLNKESVKMEKRLLILFAKL
ncbi:uncharacterized protein A4U43_C03F12750 [Asparagus officinalis]|uniref:Phosphatidate cytidylyltransferase, mitochondrial n=1 Tax=Asparagus officinalis TaxID=4686 RepID=A0A5P1F9L4_ASPOF|nr:phosphatidate cytidylyltransferase, mitochondrial isoform X2 [Asparagus officinalis]ONK75045.1 uncharacterized protein A4U43_C03F12750 [Asparagus officinalis]